MEKFQRLMTIQELKNKAIKIIHFKLYSKLLNDILGVNFPIVNRANILRLPYFIALFFISVSTFSNPLEAKLTFRKMLVEYSENPINIDEPHPRFSWIIASGGRSQAQQSYRILVSSSKANLIADHGDLWDSQKVESSETIQHEYGNSNLQSNSTYYWKVIFWDTTSRPHESPIAKFETSFLADGGWKGEWIGKDSSVYPLPTQGFYKDTKEQSQFTDSIIHDGRSLLIRKEVSLPRKIKSAKVSITGLGFYEFYINGARVGDHVLAPAKTPYHQYILYDSYDVSSLLTQGSNTFGIHLGNGWYNPYKKWWNDYRMQWFGSKKAIAQIEILFADGTTQTIVTDSSWRWTDGPVTYNCVYDGEVYDSNQDQLGWNTNGYNDSLWKQVTTLNQPKVRLVAHRMPPIKVHEIFKPIEVKRVKENVRVYDMGQNFAGWVQLKATGERNTILKIRFAEDLTTDGNLDITSNEFANATAEYCMNGRGVETYESAFTYFGFKYVEVSAQNGPLNIIALEGRAVYSDNSLEGSFESDNQLVNKIHKATVWSQKSNMMGYPMDCPQRDERLGWFGDAQVTAEEAMYNFDMALFYQNWLEGIKANQDEKTGDIPIISPRPYIADQGVEWSSTYLLMVWQFYNHYGDQRLLARHYSTMKRYMDFLDHLSTDLILPKGWIGDWGSMVKGWKEGEPASVPTAFYYLNATIMSDAARVLGYKSDEQYFKKLAFEIKDKFNKSYLNDRTANYNDGSQMANAFPLFLGLVPDSLKDRVLKNLITDIVEKNNTHLTTGVLGTKYMPEALAMMGHADVAWGIITQKSAPSWNAMMNLYTTMCEFWTLKQSKNHVMMGSIDAWFYKYIAGIQLDKQSQAFGTFLVKPELLDSLGYAKAHIETLRGSISTEWKRVKGLLTLHVIVPFNTSATVFIPGSGNDEFFESGIPIKQVKEIENLGFKEGSFIVKVHSGNYLFTVQKR
jgi:alpha-L-rhamnosidase